MHTFASVAAFSRHLALSPDAASVEEEARLLSALISATTLIESATARTFTPILATLHHDCPRYERQELFLRDDVLELHSLTNGDGRTLDVGRVVVLYHSVLHLLGDQRFDYLDSPHAAIAVRGLWGWHDAPERMWRSSGDSLSVALDAAPSASLSEASVHQVNASSADGLPRFQVGQLLRLEDEFAVVTQINSAQNRLSLLRGLRGTSASAHPSATPIAIYQPPEGIVRLCLRLATWLYREPQALDGALPPASLAQALQHYVRQRVA